MAPFIAGQSEQSLPAKFLLQLVVQQGPAFLQGQKTIWYPAVVCAFPSFGIREVKVIVQKVGLQSLQRAVNHLPPVFRFLERSEGHIPAGPEQVLSALIKGVVDLPNREKMLLDDRVPRVRILRVHVIDHID